MTHAPASNGIEELYRSVIQDVIDQSKEAFLDENIDTDILFQIQKAWEEKINASGAADLNQKAQPAPVTRPPPQVKQQPSSSKPNSNASRAAPTMVIQETSAPSTSNNHAPSQQQFTTAAALPMYRNTGGGGNQIQYNMVLDPNNPNQMIMLPVQLNGAGGVILSQEQLNQFQQNDGESFIPNLENAEISLDLNAKTLIIDTSKQQNDAAKIGAAIKKMKGMEVKKTKKRLSKKKKSHLALMIPQVDGGGPHMSSSSSEEEEEEDTLTRIVNRIDDKGENEDDDEDGDEEPLNSGDDQSDDEDLDTLFESTNIIVCQFEKVNRARNKWKFTLKDGIMHLEGKDYCFQKCTGEAEW